MVIGVAVPLVAVVLTRSRFTVTTSAYEALTTVSIGLIVLALAELTHANLFLAAFAAGITLATTAPELRDSFEEFGELVTELLKLVAILVFGALISPAFLAEIPVLGYVFALLAILVARPVAIAISLAGSRLPLPEQAAVAWFGPKGFASVVYGLIVLDSGAGRADEMFHLVALVVTLSILAHSSTDVPIAHYFARQRSLPHPPGSASLDGEEAPESSPVRRARPTPGRRHRAEAAVAGVVTAGRRPPGARRRPRPPAARCSRRRRRRPTRRGPASRADRRVATRRVGRASGRGCPGGPPPSSAARADAPSPRTLAWLQDPDPYRSRSGRTGRRGFAHVRSPFHLPPDQPDTSVEQVFDGLRGVSEQRGRRPAGREGGTSRTPGTRVSPWTATARHPTAGRAEGGPPRARRSSRSAAGR